MESCRSLPALSRLRSQRTIPLILSLGSVFAQTNIPHPGQLTRLTGRQTMVDELSGEQRRSYLIAVNPDQYLHLTVVARGPDMVGELYAPDESKSVVVNTLDFPGRAAPVLWVANTAGDYRLEVRLKDQSEGSARYEIRVDETRPAQEADRIRAEAEKLFSQAQIVVDDKLAYDGAIELYDRALTLYRNLDDHSGEIATLIRLGNSTSYLGKEDRALEYYQQALVPARRINDRRGEGRILTNIALVHRKLGDSQKAVNFLEQALAIARQIKDRQYESWALYSLASAYDDASQHEKAIRAFEQALTIARKMKDHQSEGQALNGIGWAYSGLSQYRKAIRYYEPAAKIFQELKDRLREASVLANMARLLHQS